MILYSALTLLNGCMLAYILFFLDRERTITTAFAYMLIEVASIFLAQYFRHLNIDKILSRRNILILYCLILLQVLMYVLPPLKISSAPINDLVAGLCFGVVLVFAYLAQIRAIKLYLQSKQS